MFHISNPTPGSAGVVVLLLSSLLPLQQRRVVMIGLGRISDVIIHAGIDTNLADLRKSLWDWRDGECDWRPTCSIASDAAGVVDEIADALARAQVVVNRLGQ